MLKDEVIANKSKNSAIDRFLLQKRFISFKDLSLVGFFYGVICISQAVCQFFCEYLIILAQRGKNRSGD